jgi:hypothetical protein
MRKSAMICVCGWLLLTSLQAATKSHTISFGKWQSIKWNTSADNREKIELKVRPLFLDGRIKEYTIGQPHDVTERIFVVRRAFRINDALPGEASSPAQWRWEQGGWLSVDRSTGRLTLLALPLMDTAAHDASWYRDYVAYCGVSEDGKKLYAIVAQLGRRKLLLRKYIGFASGLENIPACSAPHWERTPARVTFDLPGTDKFVFAVHTRVLNTVDDNPEEEQ